MAHESCSLARNATPSKTPPERRIQPAARSAPRPRFAALLSALGFLALSAESASAQSWFVRSPMPARRGALAAATVGSRIHVLGGDLTWGGGSTSTRNDVYDPATDSWSAAAPVPDANTWGCVAAVLGDDVYLLGGWPGANAHRVYHAATNSWAVIASPGSYYYGHAAAGLGGLVYLVGNGNTGGPLSLKSYDPQSNAWTARVTPPAQLTGYLSAAAVGGKLYVVGAGTPLGVYDPTANAWSLGAPLPVSVYAPAAAAIGGELYVFGGSTNGNASTTVRATAQRYDPATNAWSLLPDMPTARHWCAAASVAGSAFVFGGFNGSGNAINPGPNEEWRSGLFGTELRWSDALGFGGTDGVHPNAGLPGHPFEFRVDYFDGGGLLPAPGHPKLRLDTNGDGIADVEHVMLAADADADVTDGKSYFYPVPLADPGAGSYRYAFSAQNASGAAATGAPTDWTSGPDVRANLYQLAIFADDLLFSNPTPAVGETFTVTVRFDNDSLLPVTDVLVAVESEGEIVFSGTVAQLDPGATGELSFPWAFAQEGFYPLRAYVDFDGQYEEWNELDNNATRPVVAGEYPLPGSIELLGLPAQTTYSIGGYVGFSGSARYLGTPLDPPPVVQGGTITFRPSWGSAVVTHTDDAGRFAVSFPAPTAASTWRIDVEATDYTLSSSYEIVLVPPPNPPSGPNLRVSLAASASSVCVGSNVSLSWSVTNAGNQPSPPTLAELGAAGEAPLAEDVPIPALVPGETYLLASEIVSASVAGGRSYTARVDPDNTVAELSELDNLASAGFQAYPVCFEWDPDYVRFSPGPRCTGAPVGMSFLVRNWGCLDAPPTTVRFRVDGNFVEDAPFAALGGKGQQGSIGFTHVFPAAGQYVVSFELDPLHAAPECDDGNNLITAQVVIVDCTGTVDYQLDACAVAASDEHPAVGQAITFRATVRNQGSLPGAVPLAVRFLLDGVPIGPDVTTGAPLPAGGSALVGSDAGSAWTVDLAPHLLEVVLDPNHLEAESSEVNNRAARVLPYELRWVPIATCPGSGASFFSTCSPCVGDPVTISGRVVNAGLFAVSGAVGVAFEDGYGGAPVSLGSVQVSNLAARGECAPPDVHAATLPGVSFAAAGSHPITLRIDPGNVWPEYDETNNALTRSLSVSSCIPAPDLTIRSEHINPEDLNPAPGETIDWVILTVFNQGPGVAAGVTGDLYMDGLPLCSALAFGTVAPGASSSVQCTMPWPAPPGPPNLHVLQALIDPANAIAELEETNNAATRAIVVGPAPDLYPKIAELHWGADAPGSLAASIRVSNAGAVAASTALELRALDAAGTALLIETIPVSLPAGPDARVLVPVTWSWNPSTVAVRVTLSGTAPQDYDETNDRSERALDSGPLRRRKE